MELKLPTPAQLREVYTVDLVRSFLPAELKPLKTIEELWAQGCYQPWCLFDGGKIIGQGFFWLGNPGWVLLDYLCVSPERRNTGVGGLLLQQIRRSRPDAVILAEAEAPEHAPDPAMAKRRLAFYRRGHARLAGYDAEIFGVHYKNIYWADRPVLDEELAAQHRFIYSSHFGPEKYRRFIRIPREPDAAPMPQKPWDE